MPLLQFWGVPLQSLPVNPVSGMEAVTGSHMLSRSCPQTHTALSAAGCTLRTTALTGAPSSPQAQSEEAGSPHANGCRDAIVGSLGLSLAMCRCPRLRARLARLDHWVSSKGNKHFDFSAETFGSVKNLGQHLPSAQQPEPHS